MRNAALNASAASDCEAEVVREDALPDQAGQAAAQDAGGDERRTAATAARPHSASVNVVVGAPRPSVPLDFFIRYVLMKTSMSPSSTRLTSPTCSLVRWSFTSW